VRPAIRFLAGVGLGGGALAGYLLYVGPGAVLDRATVVTPWALALVVALVVVEGIVDGVGVWASVRPLGDGLTWPQSVQFALAGDYFDTLSPAGPVSSEPIVARFLGVETDTTYSEALAVRSVAKYVKAAAQLALSVAVGLVVVVAGGSAPGDLVATLAGAVLGVFVLGAVVVTARRPITRALVVVLAPVVAAVSSLYREEPHDRSVVERAFERFWNTVFHFRGAPKLLALVALGGIAEQILLAAALWTALAGTGTSAVLFPLVVVVPLPQVASVVPIPGSLGAYDVLLSGAAALVTGAPVAAATAAVFVVRTVSVPFAVVVGGLAAAFLRGWRP
jgi:hypothetical protein